MTRNSAILFALCCSRGNTCRLVGGAMGRGRKSTKASGGDMYGFVYAREESTAILW